MTKHEISKQYSEKNFVVYRASAGSGKTFTLALNYIAQIIKKPETEYRHILAVTFTNDAAGEMKERILNELRTLSNGEKNIFFESLKQKLPDLSEYEICRKAKTALCSILHDYSNFHICTIDGFLQKILRNLAKELGINSKFDIELDIELPIKEAVKAVINEAEKNENIIRFVEHKLEDDKWSIEKDLREFSKNIFKESFQKKETAVNKELKENPQKIKKSIYECRDIIKKYEEKMTEFTNEFFIKELSNDYFFQGTRGVPSFFNKIKNKDYSAPNSYVLQVLSGAAKSKIGDEQSLNLLKETENYRIQNLKIYNSAKIFLKFIYQLQLLSDISNKISEQSKEQNRFFLGNTNQLLSSFTDRDDASFIFEKIGANIHSVVVDEFQDTSELQWKIFKNLISEIVLSQNNFGMLVGDVKQSIYRWRNGNWKILNNIEEEFGEQFDYKSLKTNFRSAKNIVEFNNNLFCYAGEDSEKAYQDVVQEKKRNEDGFVSVDFVEENMIEKIAEKIKLLLENGVEQGDICVLCRKNNQIKKIANELPQILPEIKIISEEAYSFSSSKELQMIISALQIIAQPQNPIPRAKLCIDWGKLRPEEVEKEKCEEITKFINDETPLPLYDLIVKLCNIFEFDKTGNYVFLFAFMDKVLEYLSRNTSDINNFLDFWDEKLSRETIALPTKKSGRDGILAMSIHKSKGLQFHTVIVPFCDWSMVGAFRQDLLWCESDKKDPPFNFSLLPIEYGSGMQDSIFADEYFEETANLKIDNLNVLYVALTRAEKNLFVIAKKPSEKSGLSIQKLIKNYVKTDNFEKGKIEPHIEIKKEFEEQEESVVFNLTGKI